VHGQTNRPSCGHGGTTMRSPGTPKGVPSQTQKLKRMSIPPAFPKPQLMTRGASEALAPHAAPKPPKTAPRPSFHLQILYTLCGSLLVFLVFGEDEVNRLNRLGIRRGTVGTAIALNRTLPWNVPAYNLKQPTGNQVLKPLKVRPLVKARAMQRQKNWDAIFAPHRSLPRKSVPQSNASAPSNTSFNSSSHE